MCFEKCKIEIYPPAAQKKGQLSRELSLKFQVDIQSLGVMKMEKKQGVSDGCAIKDGKSKPFFPGFQEKKNKWYREIKHHLNLDCPERAVDCLEVIGHKYSGKIGLQEIEKSQIAEEVTNPLPGEEQICGYACEEWQKKSSQQHHCHISWIDAANPFVQIGEKAGGAMVASEDQKSADYEKTFNGNPGIQIMTQEVKGGNPTDITDVSQTDRECQQKAEKVEVVFVRDVRQVFSGKA